MDVPAGPVASHSDTAEPAPVRGIDAPRIGASLATLAIFLIMIVTVLDVGARTLFHRSVPGMIESAEIILVAAAFLGLGYAQRMKAHVSTSLVLDALPRRPARLLRRIGLVVVALYVGGVAIVSATRAWDALRVGEVRFGLIELPQWPARTAIALGFLLLLVELVRDLLRSRSRVDGRQDPERTG